jgi:hypothetical protein
MSDQNQQAETTILSREDGTQYTVEAFSLAKTKEIADRFRGEHKVNIPLPVAVRGDIEATLRNIQAFVSPEADFSEVLVAKFIGQGLRLDTQKEVKDLLSPANLDTEHDGQKMRDLPLEDALGLAQRVADESRVGAPRKKGTGKAGGKVAAAEAKVAKTANTALEMYKALPSAMRAQYRDALLSTGAVSAEDLDQIDSLEEGGLIAGGNQSERRGKR